MELDKLGLIEIKNLCKKQGISSVGDKKTLVKNLKYYLDPVEGSINNHHNRKIPSDKKIIGIKIEEKEKLNLIFKNKGQFLYYSFGYHYYLVSKQLEI